MTIHTLIFSDVHITTAEPLDTERPNWKRYKREDLFFDDKIRRMLAHFQETVEGPIELILNGDVFDFDGVTQLPKEGELPVNWLERICGLGATERKSIWKIGRILDDHPIFLATMRRWLDDGNTLVFTVGNHDMEVLWPSVQAVIRERIGGPRADTILFCEWFYISQGDTLVEHGNQYDSYCLCVDPIFPSIKLHPDDPPRIRQPFGNYASRTIVNSMGSINPYAEGNWQMSFVGFVVFFWRDVLRHEPLLPLTWLWTSVATLILSLRDGLYPAETDVLKLEERVQHIADKARSTPRAVRGLQALRVHPAFFFPWRIAKELWLDRLFLFLLIVVGSFQLMATLKVFVVLSVWWWLALLGVLFPPFLFYTNSIRSDIDDLDREVRKRMDLIAAVAGVSRVVFGHTHNERHLHMGHVEVLNPGTWSPAFSDLACTQPVGRQCVVWIRPGPEGKRVASVECWNDPGLERLPYTPDSPPRKIRHSLTPGTSSDTHPSRS